LFDPSYAAPALSLFHHGAEEEARASGAATASAENRGKGRGYFPLGSRIAIFMPWANIYVILFVERYYGELITSGPGDAATRM
jgi:hypothetical protein